MNILDYPLDDPEHGLKGFVVETFRGDVVHVRVNHRIGTIYDVICMNHDMSRVICRMTLNDFLTNRYVVDSVRRNLGGELVGYELRRRG